MGSLLLINSLAWTVCIVASVYLATGMVYSVPPEPPCGVQNAAATTSSSNGNMTTGSPAAGGETWTAGTQTTQAVEPAPTDYTPYLLGAAAIAGVGVGVAAIGGGGGGGSPASP